MKPTELMEEWKNDAQFDQLNIEGELSNVPNLHQKYLNIHTTAYLTGKTIWSEYFKLRHHKKRYYSNQMDIEEITQRGWERLDRIIPKADLEEYMSADEELSKLKLKAEFQDAIVEYCKFVLKEINNRSFQIKSLIDYKKYNAGY